MPKLDKNKLQFLVQDEDDEVHERSEQLTKEWLDAFMAEMARIEAFFLSKQNQLIDEFIALQEKFRMKTALAEEQRLADEEKAKKKQSKKLDKDKGRDKSVAVSDSPLLGSNKQLSSPKVENRSKSDNTKG